MRRISGLWRALRLLVWPMSTGFAQAARAGARRVQPHGWAADSPGMFGGPTFADVLDQTLLSGRRHVPPAPTRPRSQFGSVASTPIYGFPTGAASDTNRFWTVPGPYRRVVEKTYAAATASPVDRPTSRRDGAGSKSRDHRPSRRLTPSQDVALKTFLRLGGSIDSRFTPQELRSAFRALAHRYHPDRYPDISDTERRLLSAKFAELTRAYSVLNDAL